MRIVDNVKVANFKSLRDVSINGCKSFNVFIGRPNVGKSNIIEALTIFAIPYLASKTVKVSEFLRANRTTQLFFNGDVSQNVVIDAAPFKSVISYKDSTDIDITISGPDESRVFEIVNLQLKKPSKEYPTFKTYLYDKHGNDQLMTNIDMPFLCPLGGNNLMRIVQDSAELTDLFAESLKTYELGLMFNTATQEINIVKHIDQNKSYIVPFTAIADTLKRFLFYAAAVVSNKDSVIMLEEPEAHEYPPYISNMTQLIMHNKQNQYFITTHSPYVLSEFLESDMRSDLAIHVVDYKNGETILHTLSDEEMEQAYNAGIDFFFNTEIFFEE